MYLCPYYLPFHCYMLMHCLTKSFFFSIWISCRFLFYFILKNRPWHVFVDTSPDTDSDFQVAATFDVEPTLDEINLSIVECLEGSEQEDEIVAQQMQQALEDGQLNKVSDMIGEALERYNEDKDEPRSSSNKDEDDQDPTEEDIV